MNTKQGERKASLPGGPWAGKSLDVKRTKSSGQTPGAPRYVRASELARMAGVGRSAITNAVKSARLTPRADGLFDLESGEVRDYLTAQSGQRLAAQERKAGKAELAAADEGHEPCRQQHKPQSKRGEDHREAPESFAEARTRRERARADREEIARGVAMTKYLDREVVVAALTAVKGSLEIILGGFAEREGPALVVIARSGSDREFELLLEDKLNKARHEIVAAVTKAVAALPQEAHHRS